MLRRFGLLAGWTAATAAVVALGWAAVSAVAGTVTDPPPLAQPPAATPEPAATDQATDEQEPAPTVTDEPAPPADTAPAAAPTPPAQQPPGVETRAFDLAGGTVGIRATEASVELVYATPRAGFTVDVRSRGPSRVEVRFSSDEHESRFRYDLEGGERVEERSD